MTHLQSEEEFGIRRLRHGEDSTKGCNKFKRGDRIGSKTKLISLPRIPCVQAINQSVDEHSKNTRETYLRQARIQRHPLPERVHQRR